VLRRFVPPGRSASSPDELQDLCNVELKSTIVATGKLLSVMFFGGILLRDIFRVELYALRIAGGAVLLTTGFNALRKGVFYVHFHLYFIGQGIIPPYRRCHPDQCPDNLGICKVPSIFRAACFNRRTWMRCPLDNRFVLVILVLSAMVVNPTPHFNDDSPLN
jgi:hypothetical protein